ncbi:MAG TPA: class I SAM-dependent methyltransferase [Bryobacteraceae bacterium]|nr:class I SAM-dependent methyltransferase [Bryobacteraceae bacterium]
MTSAYDQVSYLTHPLPEAHPGRLATVATLFGMSPPPVETCRVLEIGCGDGSHLVPIALALPGTECVGIDLAGVPIEKGRELARRLSLSNIVLRQLDLRDLDPGCGQFDYIVTHGLYSWLPPGIRDRLLAICRALLAPQGVAFVSYNTYPGGHLRQMVRDMLLYDAQGVVDPAERIERATALLRFLAEFGTRSTALREEIAEMLTFPPPALFHDDMAEVNEPVHFHQFVQHASRHGLQFLAEAEFKVLGAAGLSGKAAETLRAMAGGDRIREQQYLDFLRCRRFRQTLLCRAETALSKEPDLVGVTRLWVASGVRPLSAAPDSTSDREEAFQSLEGHTVRTNLPLAKAALVCLSRRWPVAVPFAELAEEVASQVSSGPKAPAQLAELLLGLCTSGLVDFHALPSRFAGEAGETPRTFLLARLQAESGTRVTTLRHNSVELQDDLVRRLLLLADGTRNRDQLLSEMNVPLADLERNLADLALLALLEA